MNLHAQKTIAVMGATGLQGGAVIRAFNELKENGNKDYVVRGISRDPTSSKADAIKPFLDEFVQADADNEESMVKAFDGCYGAFVVTDFFQDFDVRHEIETTRLIKEAAKKAKLEHVVLSTLDDTRQVVKKADNKDTWKVLDEELGMYVPHFDGKGSAARDFVSEVPTTKLLTTMYMESFINYGMGPSRQNKDDPYAITFPMGEAKLSLVSLKDIGKCVCAILQDPSKIGTTQGIMSEALTCASIAKSFETIFDEPVHYNSCSTEVYGSFGFPGAADLANMFRFFKEFEEEVLSSRSPSDDLLKVMGGLDKFEDWLLANESGFQR